MVIPIGEIRFEQEVVKTSVRGRATWDTIRLYLSCCQ